MTQNEEPYFLKEKFLDYSGLASFHSGNKLPNVRGLTVSCWCYTSNMDLWAQLHRAIQECRVSGPLPSQHKLPSSLLQRRRELGFFHWQSKALAWQLHGVPLLTATDKSHGLSTRQGAKLCSLHVSEREGTRLLVTPVVTTEFGVSEFEMKSTEDPKRSGCCAWRASV